MDIEKVGQFIKELRKEKNLSQNQLSEEIHVTRQAISAWENGKAVPDSNILLLLSSYFNVSINEILLGKRLTEEEGLEQIALQLIDENNNKIRRIKKLIISFTATIVILLFFFLGYYFINNYNSIKVYKIDGISTNFMTNNGIFVATNNKVYLRLGKISQHGEKDKKNINKVRLYFKNKNNKEHVLFEESKTDILIDENYGYKEYFYNNDLNIIINNMYLEITYDNDDKEIIKLNIEEKFKNDFIFYKKKDSINVLKNKMEPKNIKKREDFINKISSDAKAKVEEQMKIRKELDLNSPQEDQKEEKADQKEEIIFYESAEDTNYEETICYAEPEEKISVENKAVEDNKIVEENEIVIEEPPEEEEQPEVIDYEKIINIIMDNGINMEGTYVYEFIKDDVIYSVTYELNMITIYIMNENITEIIQLYIDKDDYYYQKLIDYNEKETASGNIYSNIDIKSKIDIAFD